LGEDEEKMNCQQFQEVLPEIIDNGGNELEEHLRTCTACEGLVRDLQYIAQEARLSLPMHDPSPKVWASIEQSLQREGLLREGRTQRLGNVVALPMPVRDWTITGWVLSAAAVLLFGAVLVGYHPALPAGQPLAQNDPAQSTLFDGEDQQVLSQVSQQEPVVRQAYADSLREVNGYIADARKAADLAPGDTVAQEHLADAYQQKEMLYQMATARSLP
jgi:hypothetical protein